MSERRRIRHEVVPHEKSVFALILASTVSIPATGLAETPREQAVIVNHKTWTDTDGNPILAHDGGITRFGDTFYW